MFTIFRYAWSPDILKLLNDIIQFFIEHKFGETIKFYELKYGKFKKIIDEVLYNEAQLILNEIKKGMYLLPGNWSIPLLKIKSIEIENDLIKENPFKHILLNHGNSGTEDEMIMRRSFTALLYLSLEDNIYDYLSYLKSVILNKVTGIMNGDYEIWEKLYDVCLKIYSKKG